MSVLVAGTFDLLHKGHETLLDKAFSFKKPVVIGVASDAFVQKNKSYVLQNLLKIRKEKIKLYCAKFSQNFSFYVFEDMYGDSITNNSYTDIVVSKETLPNALKINNQRKNKLHIHSIPMVRDELNLGVISSHRIMSGEIDLDGKVFFSSAQIVEFKINSKQRDELQNIIWGSLVTTPKKLEKKSILVGDVTCNQLYHLKPFILVFDHIINRIPVDTHEKFSPSSVYTPVQVTNKPGLISKELQKTIYEHKSHQYALKIEGEEDLVSLAYVLIYPLDTVVYYGQPGKGLVRLPCSLEWKRNAYQLLYGKSRS